MLNPSLAFTWQKAPYQQWKLHSTFSLNYRKLSPWICTTYTRDWRVTCDCDSPVTDINRLNLYCTDVEKTSIVQTQQPRPLNDSIFVQVILAFFMRFLLHYLTEFIGYVPEKLNLKAEFIAHKLCQPSFCYYRLFVVGISKSP